MDRKSGRKNKHQKSGYGGLSLYERKDEQEDPGTRNSRQGILYAISG